MKSSHRTTLAVLCIGVAFFLQGCNNRIVQSVTAKMDELMQEGCKSAVSVMIGGLNENAVKQIGAMCSGKPPTCSVTATDKINAELTAQKANQTTACITKIRSMFNMSALPDFSAIADAAGNFELSQKDWSNSWLKQKLDETKAMVTGGTVPTTTTAAAARLYAAAPEQPIKKLKEDKSSMLPMLSLGVVGAAMVLGSVAFAFKRFSARRGVADLESKGDADGME
jgi:hypothetical protein